VVALGTDLVTSIATCDEELPKLAFKISEVESRLTKATDLEERTAVQRQLAALREAELLYLEKKEKATAKLENEQKRATRALKKKFYVSGVDEREPYEELTVVQDRDGFKDFKRESAPRGLREVGETASKLLITKFDQIKHEAHYSVIDSPLSSIREQINDIENANKNRAAADEEAMGRAAEVIAHCLPGFKPVPAARKIFRWPDDESAMKYAALVDRQVRATTPQELADIDREIAALLKLSELKDESTCWHMEFDAAFFADDGTVVLVEAKSRLTDEHMLLFHRSVQVAAFAAKEGTKAYAFLKGKNILPIAFGNHIDPWRKVLDIAQREKILLFGRNGSEYGRVLNPNAPPLSGEAGNDLFCKYVSAFVRTS